MQTHKKPSKTGSVLCGTAVLGVALGLVGCGGQIAFAGSTPLTIVGEPPPPPPPPPAPPPKVEAPKPPPRVEVRDNSIDIHEKIQFEVNKATIKAESFGLLDEIVKVIKENAYIKKIQIEGHASAEGDAKHNMKLSDDRAKAVRKYLVDHGVEADHLIAKGFGITKPLASNDTEEGKEKNRRVEFNILEQDVTKRKVEIDPSTGKEKLIEETKTTVSKPVADEAKPDAKDAKKDTKDVKKDAKAEAKDVKKDTKVEAKDTKSDNKANSAAPSGAKK